MVLWELEMKVGNLAVAVHQDLFLWLHTLIIVQQIKQSLWLLAVVVLVDRKVAMIQILSVETEQMDLHELLVFNI